MGGEGVEPSTSSLSEKRSTDELVAHLVLILANKNQKNNIQKAIDILSLLFCFLELLRALNYKL